MPGNDTTYLLADPYAHQPNSSWKLERTKEDNQILCSVLDMRPEQILAASKSFAGQEKRLFRFIFAARFLDYVDRGELRENASIFKVLSRIFAIEGIASGDMQNKKRLERFLVKYLVTEEKLRLLNGYLFTSVHLLGKERQHERHIMFQAAVADRDFRSRNYRVEDPEYCTTTPYGACFCSPWLRDQAEPILDKCVAEFSKKLYQMRCAVVHDATPVLFGAASDQKPPDVKSWSFSLVYTFTVGAGGYVTYESGMLIPETISLLTNGLRRCFEDGANF
ncbi:MAG: hypothetical protein NVS9B4_08800 [Candidatus Acidiferrum sp.]